MGLSDWFSFESAKEKKKKQERYYKKLYPLGKQQQELEQTAVDRFFSDRKNKKPYLFELIILREKLESLNDSFEYDEDEEKPEATDIINRWRKNKPIYKISDEEKEIIIKIALAEFGCESIEMMKIKLEEIS